MTMRTAVTAALATAALTLGAAGPASAHYIKVTPAREAAEADARKVYLDSEATDYGWDDCIRHSSHRVSCLAVVEFDDDSQMVRRVYLQSRAARYQWVTTYGRWTTR